MVMKKSGKLHKIFFSLSSTLLTASIKHSVINLTVMKKSGKLHKILDILLLYLIYIYIFFFPVPRTFNLVLSHGSIIKTYFSNPDAM